MADRNSLGAHDHLVDHVACSRPLDGTRGGRIQQHPENVSDIVQAGIKLKPFLFKRVGGAACAIVLLKYDHSVASLGEQRCREEARYARTNDQDINLLWKLA